MRIPEHFESDWNRSNKTMDEARSGEIPNTRTNDHPDSPETCGGKLVTDASLVEPIYAQAEPSQPIALGTVAATFAHAEETDPREASVCMRFTPDERLCFTFQTGPTDLVQAFRDRGDLGEKIGQITLTDRRVKFDAFCVRKETGSQGGKMIFVPQASVVTATEPSINLSEAIFHLFNFPVFFGPEDYFITTGAGPQSGWSRYGRSVLKADGWTITIAGTDKTEGSREALKEHGGFIITHMGKIVRDDGSPFSSEQLEGVLNWVHSFLSLALGRWAGVALPIGFDKDGHRAFEQWGMPMVASGSWTGSCSWFDAHHGELLSDLFPEFLRRWKDDLWGPAIRRALYWYIAANDRGTGVGVDVGLVLAQTALEELAWTYCMRDRKMVSDRAFGRRGLSAADKLRLLTTALEIPTDVPADLRALRAKRGQKWDDGADAITSIRNSLVHPNTKTECAGEAYFEAWMLSLWFLDLVFLRLLGHEGQYANRLLQRGLEAVPWRKDTLHGIEDES